MGRIAMALFLGTLVLLPVQLLPPLPQLHPRLQWSDIAFGLAFPIWLASRPRLPIGRGPALAMLLYLGSALLAWLFGSPGAEAGAVKLLGIGSLLALAVMTASLTRDDRGAALAGRAVAAAALVASLAALAGALLFLAGIPNLFLGPFGDLVPGSYPRLRGTFTHPNGLASFTIAAVGLLASRRAGLPPTILRVLRILLVFAAVVSLSRGVLGLAVALAIAAARTPRRRILALVTVAAALAAVTILSVSNLALDPTRPLQAVWRETPSPRRQALTTAARTAVEHPLGIGPGALPAQVDGRPFEAHCTPLNVAATLGLPAAAALLLLPILLWQRRRRPTDLAVWGALAGLAIDALAQDVEDFRHVWLLLGWLWGERESR
jgi:hypothetical protein